MENHTTISGYVFAGGKSRRMGTDKALLVFQDNPLLLRMTNLLEPFCENVAISGYKKEYLSYNIEMVPDVYSGCGPISGILSCLKHSKTDWNLLISVDVPFVNEDLIRYLISNIDESDCIMPKHHSGVEPLVALYHKNALPVIEEMILREEFKLMTMLSKLNTKYMDCDELIKKNPQLFHNLNSPDDYKSI